MSRITVEIDTPPWKHVDPTRIREGEPAITLRHGQRYEIDEAFFDPSVMRKVEADEEGEDPDDSSDAEPDSTPEGDESEEEAAAEGASEPESEEEGEDERPWPALTGSGEECSLCKRMGQGNYCHNHRED